MNTLSHPESFRGEFAPNRLETEPDLSEEGFFIWAARHLPRFDKSGFGYGEGEESEEYPGLKEQETGKVEPLVDSLEKTVLDMPDNGVLFLGGSSQADRTESTINKSADRLKDRIESKDYEGELDEDNIKILTQEEVEMAVDEVPIEKKVKKNLEDHDDKKVVVTFPLFLDEFSLRPHHRELTTDTEGAPDHQEYMSEFVDRSEKMYGGYLERLFKDNGRLYKYNENEEKITDEDGNPIPVTDENNNRLDENAPGPTEMAEKHLKGIIDLYSFAKKYTEERSTGIGISGHGSQIDSLGLYLAVEGDEDEMTYENLVELFGEGGVEQGDNFELVPQDDGFALKIGEKTYEVSSEFINSIEEKIEEGEWNTYGEHERASMENIEE